MSDIVKLQKDLEDLKKAADLSLVENAITCLRQLISRPAALFDPQGYIRVSYFSVWVLRDGAASDCQLWHPLLLGLVGQW